MRRLVLERGTDPGVFLAELATASPLELVLVSAPDALGRRELLEAVARAEALLVTTFAGTLRTPLAELALLALASSWQEGARLDLRGALLSPLIGRAGLTAARRLLRAGPVLDPRMVLAPWRGPVGRSPAAVRLATGLLASPCGPRALLAEERAAFQLVMSSADRSEGIRAFTEKRLPRFGW